MPKILGQDRYTTFMQEEPEDSAMGSILQTLRKTTEESMAKKEAMDNAIKSMLLKAALNKMQLKQGANLSQVDTSQGLGGVLAQVPNLFEREKIQPTTSVSITQRPYSEMLKAREILGRTPEEYGKAGMATPGARIAGTGLFGTGWGPGSKRSYNLSPEAIAEQAEAKSILGTPRKTIRISGKGNMAGILDDNISTELPDPAETEEGSVYQTDDGKVYKLVNGEWIETEE